MFYSINTENTNSKGSTILQTQSYENTEL